jgi:hypothetical protein
MCNALKLDLEEIISKENQRVATLGIFHLR